MRVSQLNFYYEARAVSYLTSQKNGVFMNFMYIGVFSH